MLTTIQSSYLTKTIALATFGLLSCTNVATAQQCSIANQAASSSFISGYPYLQGVTLDKTLEMLNGYSDLTAAAYSPETGEFVFIGIGEALAVSEQINIDDMIVAAKAIFGLNEDPGISFTSATSGMSAAEAEALSLRNFASGNYDVTYFGATQDTQFGQILYDADYILKKLSLGVDEGGNNLLGKPDTGTKLAALNYYSFAELFFTRPLSLSGRTVEFDFRPKRVAMKQNETDNAALNGFVFDEVTMKVQTRIRNPDGTEESGPECDALPPAEPLLKAAWEFACSITNNFDSYAAIPEFTELNKLKRLAKITALLRWVRDNNLPIDLSFVSSYTPSVEIKTPKKVAMVQVCEDPTNVRKISALSPPYQPGISNCLTNVIHGGVSYDKDNEYCNNTDVDCLSPSDRNMLTGAIDTLISFAQGSATAVDERYWPVTFVNEAAEEIAATASAVSLNRSRKNGDLSFSRIDLSLPNQSGQSLSFSRYYNSFDLGDQGLGRGWSPLPFSIDTSEGRHLYQFTSLCSDNIKRSLVASAIKGLTLYDRVLGQTVSFVPNSDNPCGSAPSDTITYLSEAGDFILETGENAFELYMKDKFGVTTKVITFGRFGDANAGEYKYLPLAVLTPLGEYKENWWAELDTNGVSVNNFLNYSYDGEGRLLAIESMAGRIEVIYQNKKIERAVLTTSAGKRQAIYTYENNRLKTVTSAEQTIQYSYQDTENNKLSSIISRVENITRGEILFDNTGDTDDRIKSLEAWGDQNLATNYEYDRLAGTTVINDFWIGELNQYPRTITENADEKGRVTHTTLHIPAQVAEEQGEENISIVKLFNDTANSLAGPTDVTDERNNLTKISYYSDGSIKSITDPLLRTWESKRGYDYDDGLSVIIYKNPKGYFRVRKFDNLGRLKQELRQATVNNYDSPVACPIVTTNLCFTITKSAGYSTDYSYDSTGLVSQIKNDAGQFDKVLYPWISTDEATAISARNVYGQATQVTTASGKTISYDYDSLARLRTVQGPADISPVVYDYYGQGLEQDQVRSVSSSFSKSEHLYDVLNRKKSVTDDRGVTTAYIHNRQGQLSRVVEIGPDGANILTTQYVYDPLGKLKQKLLPNGSRVEYVYDALDRLKSITEVEGAPLENANPVVTTLPPTDASVMSGGQYSLDVNANDADAGDTLSYLIVSGPEGLQIDPLTGLITWKPSSDFHGVYTVVVQVSDDMGGVTNLTFDIQVGEAIVDTDSDTVADSADNCPNIENLDQRDTDGDGVGNRCDADLNNDGYVNFEDMAILKSWYGTANDNADLNGDGLVNDEDLAIFKPSFSL